LFLVNCRFNDYSADSLAVKKEVALTKAFAAGGEGGTP